MSLQISPEIAVEIEAKLDDLDADALALVKWRLEYVKHARPKQLPPDGDWIFFMMPMGRGAGKTWTGSHWLGLEAAMNPGYTCALVAATHNDVRRTCIEGDSGLLRIIPPILLQGVSIETGYNRSNMEITFANGSKIVGLSAEKPDRIRGGNFAAAWCDELTAWQGQTATGSSTNMREAFDMLMLALRVGSNPRCIIPPRPKTLATYQGIDRRQGLNRVHWLDL